MYGKMKVEIPLLGQKASVRVLQYRMLTNHKRRILFYLTECYDNARAKQMA